MTAVQHEFVKDWIKAQTKILKQVFPDRKKEEIVKYLEKQVQTNLIDQEVSIHNNYRQQRLNTSLLDVIDWIKEKQPICAGFGMFYKNQHRANNPNSGMIINFLNLRKVFKNQLKDYLEGSYEYATADRKQMTEKVNVNAFYGCNGAPRSRFYNLYTAASVTLTGQSLLSTTAQALEAFLTNNVPFQSLDECFDFMERVRKDDVSTVIEDMEDVSLEQVLNRLKETFFVYSPSFDEILLRYLSSLDQDVLNRLYYKNNLYAFCRIPSISAHFIDMIERTDSFMSPAHIPEEIEEDMDTLWHKLSDWVFHNHSPYNRINRLRTHTRKCVVLCDTDSNMINLHPWVEFIHEELGSQSATIASRDYDDVRFIAVNVLCTFLTNMIAAVLNKYAKTSNIPSDHHYHINMKNEYLFTKMVLIPVKKRYIASIRLREGKEIFPEKLEIKGLDFVKSSTREETLEVFKKIIKTRIVEHASVDLINSMRDLKQFAVNIRESLQRGEKTYLSPENAKEPEAYADPYRMQSFRAVMAWNIAYPEQQIALPEKVDAVKLNVSSMDDLQDLEETHPEIYENLVEGLFEGDDEKLRAKGLTVIAIPRNVERIPDWIIPLIDYESIINKNVSQFESVLESMGSKSFKLDDRTIFTNIKKVG